MHMDLQCQSWKRLGENLQLQDVTLLPLNVYAENVEDGDIMTQCVLILSADAADECMLV